MNEFCLIEYFKNNTTGAAMNLAWRSTSLSVCCEKRMPNFENGDPWEEGERLVALRAVHDVLISITTKDFLYEFVAGVIVEQDGDGERVESDTSIGVAGFTTNNDYLSKHPSTLKVVSGSDSEKLFASIGRQDGVIDKANYASKEYELRKCIIKLMNEVLKDTSKSSHNRKVSLQNMIDDIHERGIKVSIAKTMALATSY